MSCIIRNIIDECYRLNKDFSFEKILHEYAKERSLATIDSEGIDYFLKYIVENKIMGDEPTLMRSLLNYLFTHYLIKKDVFD